MVQADCVEPCEVERVRQTNSASLVGKGTSAVKAPHFDRGRQYYVATKM